MSRALVTVERLASAAALTDLLGKRPDRRWGRASLNTPRSDGHSIASWFGTHEPEARIGLVREALLESAAWSDLLRVYIPKRQPGEFRAVDRPIVLDQARLYRLSDALARHAETVLSPVAVGFRPGRQLHQTILGAYVDSRRRSWACVVDIRSYFDNVSWSLIDTVIGDLPATTQIKDTLRLLVRAPVVETRGRRPVHRSGGLLQGLSCSPTLANLLLNGWDRQVGHALGKMGVSLRRYCDDILLLAPSQATLLRATGIVTDRLSRLGLEVRAGTGRAADLCSESIVWLGISFGPSGVSVPSARIAAKTAELQAEIDQEVISSLELEDVLMGLLRHYQRIVPDGTALAAISTIRDGLRLPISFGKQEVNSKTLEGLYDRSVRGLRHPSALDERDRTHGSMESNLLRRGTLSLVNSALCSPDEKSRTRSTGVPAQSTPVAAENPNHWRLGVWVASPTQCRVVARRLDERAHQYWQFAEPAASSTTSLVLAAIRDAISRLRHRAARHITVVVGDPTLRGYVTRGWRVRSLDVYRAIERLNLEAGNLTVELEPLAIGKPRKVLEEAR